MSLRRGFKAWAERKAASIRSEMGIDQIAPLPIRRLSKDMKVRILDPRKIPGFENEFLEQLTIRDKNAWSGFVIHHFGRAAIVINPTHSKRRLSSDIAHELSHIICGHEPPASYISENGMIIQDKYDEIQEEEANELSSTILLPRVSLIHIMEQGLTLEEAAELYVVSNQLLNMRLNKAGVRRQFARRMKAYS